MGLVRAADPVKQFVAVLWSEVSSLDSALVELRERWGEVDFIGAHHDFDITEYYAAEMGGNLKRTIVSFRSLVPPESLVEAKLACNEIESRHAEGPSRRVNLDIGYLDDNKIVLGSVKAAGQKIHLGQGVYADLVGRYRDGRYQPFEWTFPDFRDGRYDTELVSIRARYLEQIREHRRRAPESRPERDIT